MSRALVLSGLLVTASAALAMAVPATAQAPGQQCAETPQSQVKKSLFGGFLNNIANSALGRIGGNAGTVVNALPVSSMLSDAIAKLLDCKEQQQAAKATDEAIRGGVGTEVQWTSESRPNVTGVSKVTSAQAMADGGQCMTVTDIVIVDGEETSVPKKMCKAKGAKGYARA